MVDVVGVEPTCFHLGVTVPSLTVREHIQNSISRRPGGHHTNTQKDYNSNLFNMAEDIGFEPMHRLPNDALAGRCFNHSANLPNLAPSPGLEPRTNRLTIYCSTY